MAGELGFAQPRQRPSESRDFFVGSGELWEHCGNIQAWLSQYPPILVNLRLSKQSSRLALCRAAISSTFFLCRPFLWLPLAKRTIEPAKKGAFARFRGD